MESLAIFMDRKEITRRDLKIESMRGYHQANEDSFMMFPDCDKCNPQRRVIIIPNTKPVIEVTMQTFPNCPKCNTDNAVIIKEEEI